MDSISANNSEISMTFYTDEIASYWTGKAKNPSPYSLEIVKRAEKQKNPSPYYADYALKVMNTKK